MMGWMKYSRKANDFSGNQMTQPGLVVTTTKGCLKKTNCDTTGEPSSRVDSSDMRGKSSLVTSMAGGSRSDSGSAALVASSKRQRGSSHYGSTAAPSTTSAYNALSDGVHHMRVSASSVVPSLASSSYSTSSWKNVSFGTVHIREYDRAIGDNPSCSSGPPIGIGWEYRDCHRLPVVDYERTRLGRKHHLDMVLSRKEREKLLLEWEVPVQDIVDGTRTVLRIKNQRKQTVINSGKVAKLEEAIERASRRVSRALHLREGTSSKVKKLQEQADRAAAALEIMKNEYETVADDSDAMTAPSDIASSNPLAAHLDIDIVEVVEIKEESDIGMSDALTIGATTLGSNSYTQSMMEVEKFYQELELELFGDDVDLPSMVGQTLELPVISMDGDLESDCYEPCREVRICEEDCISIASSLPSIPEEESPLLSQEFLRQNNSHRLRQSYNIDSSRDVLEWRYREHDFNSSNIPTRRYSFDMEGVGGNHQHYQALAPRYHSYEPDHLIQRVQLPPNRPMQPSWPFELPDYSSRDAGGSMFPRGGTGMYSSPSLHVSALPMVSYDGDRWNCSGVSRTDKPANLPESRWQQEQTNYDSYDEPQIRHIPIQSHLSPNQWMGECDGPHSYRSATITISEEEHNAGRGVTEI